MFDEERRDVDLGLQDGDVGHILEVSFRPRAFVPLDERNQSTAVVVTCHGVGSGRRRGCHLSGGATGGLPGFQDDLGGGGDKLGEVFGTACCRVARPLVFGGPLQTLLVAWTFQASLRAVAAARLRLIAPTLSVYRC